MLIFTWFVIVPAFLTYKQEHPTTDQLDPIIYLAGSTMGLQPREIMRRTQVFLDQWASQAIQAGFITLADCAVPSWLDVEQEATRLMAPIVGAQDNEVVLMGTLTANLHFMLASFYRPTESEEKHRTKIIIEECAFSSDRVSSRHDSARRQSDRFSVCHRVSDQPTWS
jgi:kynureninase